ncbi:MAG: hypothetical protein KDD48_05925 [Bdellovibrionales bacterium]|nr:hypothetical protein [Bdellovibrionales bacterium]
MKCRILVIATFLVFSSFLLGCGGSSTVGVRILVAQNASPNLLQEIKTDLDNGDSRGIYFRFDPLHFCPSSIDDVDPSATAIVPRDPVGSDPTRSSFEIDTSALSPEKIYRVRMLAVNATGTTTHLGTINCPMSIKYPTLNQLVVCFGNISPSPVCSGLGTTYPLLFSATNDCQLTPEQVSQCF